MKKKKSSWLKRFLVLISFLLLLIFSGIAYLFYQNAYQQNVNLGLRKNRYVYIKHNATFDDVVNELTSKKILINKASFIRMAKRMNYVNNVKPGKYLILKNMGNKKLINLLKSGKQEKICFSFNGIRTKEQLAGRISNNLEVDSTEFVNMLNNDSILNKFGFNSKNIMSMFIANDYCFDTWAIASSKYMERMFEENKKFWKEERLTKCKSIPLKPYEVVTLASIVQQEQQIKKDERPIIAGVYLNRLKKNMKLQADPTVIFAVGDFSIKRVTFEHLNIKSDYNTYKNEGLPPGPICIPSANAIDAVLNFRKHTYLYFCAKEDLSGYHNFASNYSEHCVYANRYQKELNRRGIN